MSLASVPTSADEPPSESTTWEPIDLAPFLDGSAPDESPTILARADGVHTIYRGKVNGFQGESESMKSWAGQVAAAGELGAGEHVVYLDFEDTPAAVAARMRSLHVSVEVILERFHYHRPHAPFGEDAVDLFRVLLRDWRPSLVVMDGITEAMSLHGLELRDNNDVARFMLRLPRRFARTGAAVVLIDHVTKDRETRGRYAIGAQHKLAAIDGAAYTFDVVHPFGRGRDGLARMTVSKDRPGYVRQHTRGATFAELHLHSDLDGGVTAALKVPAGGDSFHPTVLMERVSRALEDAPDGLNTRALRAAVKGNHDDKALALERLLAESYVRGERDGASKRYVSVRPYRQDTEE